MKKFGLILPLIGATITLGGCWIEFGDNVKEDPKVLDAYYKGYNLEVQGTQLVTQLQKQCFDKHTQWIVYDQVGSYYSKTSDRNSIEAIADGSTKNEWFYTGKESGGAGNREHVWPCANSGGLWVHNRENPSSPNNVDRKGYFGGGSDLYHVRSCNGTVNTKRSNNRFVDFDDFPSLKQSAQKVTESNGKYPLLIASNKCEPADEMKGDVARNVLYTWLHYYDRGKYPDGYAKAIYSGQVYQTKYEDLVGTLNLTQIMGYDTEDKCKEVLKKWNKLDKPSNVEKLRNKTVQKIQGNRNPFVDYPELVDKMF